MTEDSCSQENSFRLLKQLEHILESDTLIDEVGFIHPIQFVALNEDTQDSLHPSVNSLQQSTDRILTTDIVDVDILQHDASVFWNRDHKLAISTQALLPLYNAAKLAFMAAIRQYRMLINLHIKTDRSVEETVPKQSLASETFLESEVMKHSKALLLLSCDFGSAWNSRKLVVSKKQSFSLFMDELLLSALVLSYAPKSEPAWSHRIHMSSLWPLVPSICIIKKVIGRRWVIKTIAGQYPNLQEIVGQESELVEKIAEKSKMNYRAWHHRCWLITHMTKEQMLNELKKSRKWAELHVADNCCFHYRRRLMLRILEDSCSKQNPKLCPSSVLDHYQMWKEELDWDETLIKRYIGREALWVHRRFLSQCWIKHFVSDVRSVPCHSENHYGINDDIYVFLHNEMQILHSSLTILNDDFEDSQMQAMLAATYILWVSKRISQSQGIILQEKLREIGDLKTLLNKVVDLQPCIFNFT